MEVKENNDTYEQTIEQLKLLDNNIRLFADKIQENKYSKILMDYYLSKLTKANEALNIGEVKMI